MAFSSSPRHVSLLDALNSFLETLPVQQRPDIKGCSPWEGMVSICKNPQLRKDFVRTLSLSQSNSLRLLLLWKSGSISFPTPVNFRLLRHEYLGSDEQFQALFRMEGLSKDRLAYCPANPRMLFILRKLAAEIYSYRRLLKFDVSASLRIKEPPNDAANSDYVLLEQAVREDMGGRALSSSVGSSTRGEGQGNSGLPLYLWDTWDGRTVETKCLSENSLRYAAISHTWGRWKLDSPGVDMRPMVPWLVPENGLPYSVRDLPDGLKKLAAKLSLRYIWIDLLCLPQNGSEEASREISRQAEIFGGACTAVAWLNTMPSWEVLGQTVSWLLLKPFILDKLGTPLPVKLRLFHALFNLVQSRGKSFWLWKRFFDAHERIRKRFHRLDKRLHSMGYPSIYWHAKAVESGCEDKTNAASLGFLTFHWFSSLWTLQESTLRPDMLLANGNWELFETAYKSPVALDTLCQLLWTCGKREDDPTCGRREDDPTSGRREDHRPMPVSWLGCILSQSGLFLNTYENPLQVLAIGTTRLCTGRRSEAIMSVMGCVEWHRNALSDRQTSTMPCGDPKSRHLLFGLYEYDFILEVLQRYKSCFFSSHSSSYCFFFEVLERRKPLGTILPFSAQSQYREAWVTEKLIPAWAFDSSLTHPSIDTWEVLRDASVKMSKVGILYETPDVDRRGTWGSLFKHFYKISAPDDKKPLFCAGDAQMEGSHMPLGEWMDTHWTNFAKYAVVVNWANYPAHIIGGFILAEVKIDESSSAKRLAKLADFQCLPSINGGFTLSDLPRMTDVDWIVY